MHPGLSVEELDRKILECLGQAAICESRATEARDMKAKAAFEQVATSWLELAAGFAYLKRLMPPG
jgi:hypothetical protein